MGILEGNEQIWEMIKDHFHIKGSDSRTMMTYGNLGRLQQKMQDPAALDSDTHKMAGIFQIYLIDYHDEAISHMCLDEKGDFFLRLSQKDTVLPSHLHKHDYLEMVYVLQGEIDFLIEGVHKRYRRGEVCLLNTNVRHVEEYHTDFTAIYLNMDPDYIRKVLNPGVLSGTEHTFAELTDFISRTQGDRFRDYMDFTPLEDSSGDMYRVCLRLLEEMMEKEPEYARMISLLLRRMFLFLQAPEHFSCSSTSYQIRAESTVVDRVLVLLHEQRRRLKRDEIADALGYNPSYLNRVFLEKTGQTLSEYNRRIYLREAAELLLNSSMSVSQIAEQM